MAFGLTARFEGFVFELVDLLPPEFHCHYHRQVQSMLWETYQEKYQGTFWKMKLVDRTKAQSPKYMKSENVVRMEKSHAAELEKMYETAYPDGFFDRRMLQTGGYFGYKHQDKIVSCAGIHVNSQEFGVAVLGSIATLPEFRGRGFATMVTARLLTELIPIRDVIMLNVSGQNAPAVKCYSNLGFEKTHEYEEGMFTLRK